MITVELSGDRELIAHLNAMPAKVQAALKTKITGLALKLEARIKNKLSGEVLNVRTGNLRRSIHETVEQTATSVTGKVASSGDVKYAAIHEFGGQTKAHVIEALNGKALAFSMGGKMVFARKVNHPGSKIPARPYMRPALAEMKTEIVEGMTQAVIGALK